MNRGLCDWCKCFSIDLISSKRSDKTHYYCNDCIETVNVRLGRFVKGKPSWNAGKIGLKRNSDSRKGKHYSKNTQFKPGNKPWNKKVK
jgi:hypothetical protein